MSFSTKLSALCISCLIFASPMLNAKPIQVSTAPQLQKALLDAKPGDEIVLAPGTYLGDVKTSGNRVTHFLIKNSGTKSDRITLRSADPKNKAVLAGADNLRAYALYIVADYWTIKDIKVRTAQKGIMMDGANHNIIDNVQVFDTGTEAVHFRKNSSYNLLKNCHIYETGRREGKGGLGEGVYVGTHNGHEPDIADHSNHNVIGGCHFGPNVRAEAVDIKSGTIGTVIEHNYMDGSGIIGEASDPAADSFIDIKGDQVIVRNNFFDFENNKNVRFGIMTFQEHTTSNIYDNAFNLPSDAAMLKLLKPTSHVKDNKTVDTQTSLLEKSYQKRNMDSKLDKTIEKKRRGPYKCFDEYAERCKKLAND